MLTVTCDVCSKQFSFSVDEPIFTIEGTDITCKACVGEAINRALDNGANVIVNKYDNLGKFLYAFVNGDSV